MTRPIHAAFLTALCATGCLQAPTFQGASGTDAAPDDGSLPAGSISVLAVSSPGPVENATVVVVGTNFRAVTATGSGGDVIIANVPADSTVWVERRLGASSAPVREVTMISGVQPGDHLVVGQSVAPIILPSAKVLPPLQPNGVDYRVLSGCYGYPENMVVTPSPLAIALTRTNTCDSGDHKVLAAVTDSSDQQRYSIVVNGVLNSEDTLDFRSYVWKPDTKFKHTATEVPDAVRGLYADVASVIGGAELDGPRSISAQGAPLPVPTGDMFVAAQAEAADLIYLVDLGVVSRLQQYIAHRIAPPAADVTDPIDVAPFVGPASLVAGSVAWEQDDGGSYQLLLIEGTTIRSVDNATLQYRYILPASATSSFAPPPLPEEMIDAAATSTVSYRVNLLRFDDDTTYDDVREQADVHVTTGSNYGTSFLGAQRRSPKSPISRVAQSGVKVF